jgi:hypothetical protein
MSNIFLQNNLTNLFGNENTENNITLPRYVKFVDLKNSSESVTSTFLPHKNISFNTIQSGGESSATSSFMPQNKNIMFSATSVSDMTSSFNPQHGVADFSATSSVNYQNGGGNSFSDATSSFNLQNGGADFSATSSVNYQNGGAADTFSDMTSSFILQNGGGKNRKNKQSGGTNDINNLISMITSESHDAHTFSTNSTSTDVLENRLRNMLQEGGGDDSTVNNQNEINKAIELLKSKGYNIMGGNSRMSK